MKRIILSLGVIFLYGVISPVLAQESPVDRLMKKYAGQEGILSLNAGSFKILTIDKDHVAGVFNFYNETKSIIRKSGYKELFSISEKNQKVGILAKESGGEIIELLMIVGGEDNVALSIQGKAGSDVFEALSGFLKPDHYQMLQVVQYK